eukprot:2992390-Pleurochrysis_carterae.AAC.1
MLSLVGQSDIHAPLLSSASEWVCALLLGERFRRRARVLGGEVHARRHSVHPLGFLNAVPLRSSSSADVAHPPVFYFTC